MSNERSIQLDPIDPSAPTTPEPTGTYPIQATCKNCDWAGEVQMPKGIACEKGKPTDRVSCPTCGCKTLVRDKPKPDSVIALPGTVPPDPYTQAVEQQRQLEELARRQDEFQRQQEERRRRSGTVPALPPNRQDRPYWSIGDMQQEIEQVPFVDHTVRPSTTGQGIWMNGQGNGHTSEGYNAASARALAKD